LYEIRLTTDLGCVTVDTLLVKTVKRIEVHVPTGFTPNNDGKNDRLRPLLFGIEKVNYFRIYNRWGNMVFQMQSDQPGWDGKINGILQGTQVFVWMIEVVDIDGQIHREKGTTTLLRYNIEEGVLRVDCLIFFSEKAYATSPLADVAET
jgi:gliding motility-associated-like protein